MHNDISSHTARNGFEDSRDGLVGVLPCSRGNGIASEKLGMI